MHNYLSSAPKSKSNNQHKLGISTAKIIKAMIGDVENRSISSRLLSQDKSHAVESPISIRSNISYKTSTISTSKKIRIVHPQSKQVSLDSTSYSEVHSIQIQEEKSHRIIECEESFDINLTCSHDNSNQNTPQIQRFLQTLSLIHISEPTRPY